MNTSNSTQHRRLIILGSGPAGCTAAIYAARANLAPTMLTGAEQGGQLVKTSTVDNWPGDAAGVLGFDLMQRMQQHVERFEVEIIRDHIQEVNLQAPPFLLKSSSASYSCDALIIATGAKPRYLGLPAEQRYLGHGVSTCATCDGFFYRGTRVAVMGGGSTAVDDAIYLAGLAQEVIMIHRRDHFTAEHVLAEKLQDFVAQGKVKILWQHVVNDIIGDENGVTGIKVKDLVSGAIKDETVKGIFIAIGFKPYSELFINQIAMFDDGYIKVQGYGEDGNGSFTATSIPGVFAAGDVANRAYRQAITAAGMGCMAALDVKKYFTLLSSKP